VTPDCSVLWVSATALFHSTRCYMWVHFSWSQVSPMASVKGTSLTLFCSSRGDDRHLCS